jgi:SAM-dependent methyltransferase
MTTPLHRPEPVLRHLGQSVDREIAPVASATRLRDGETLLVTDHYATGVAILDKLRWILPKPSNSAPFNERQAFRRAYREASLRLLAPVKQHRVALLDAGRSGFIKELYPDIPSFSLPFVQVQELYGAWETYIDGVHLAVLGHKLHPFYGTYVPTRTSHLELFATWLQAYDGPRVQAIDVGTGCGVLALMLCRGGFEHVLATDINPNAVESTKRELARLPVAPPIALLQGDLFANERTLADVIVFNPPWIPGDADGLVDSALYYEDGLFERFFEQAIERLKPTGRIVLLFSTIMTLLRPDLEHPIEAELKRGRLQLVNKLKRRVKPTVGPDGKPRKTRERVEVWELSAV